MLPNCLVYHLGLVPYRKAWRLQEVLASQISVSTHPPALLLLEHPHVFTFGRRGEITNLLWDESELARHGVEVIWVDRGGDATYHGPGQLVGYPLLPLTPGGLYAGIYPSGTRPSNSSSTLSSLPKADYLGYLRRLEEVLILTLAGYGIRGFRLQGKTGVFVDPSGGDASAPAKIASIGVKVDAQGISRHGFAININPDMDYWDGIIACGLAGHSAASLAQFLHPIPVSQDVEQELVKRFGDVFDFEMQFGNPSDLPLED